MTNATKAGSPKEPKKSAAQVANEKRVQEILKMVSNKDKREAVAFFDKPLGEFDTLDEKVMYAYVAAKGTNTLEELDALPLSELDSVMGLVEEDDE